MNNKKRLSFIITCLSVLSVLLLWCVLANVIDNEYLLPTVPQTLTALTELLKTSEFYISLIGTLLRSVIAFATCFLLAFFTAYFSTRSFVFKKAVEPIIAIIRALPTIAVVLLLLFWTTSKIAPVIVTALVIFPTLYTDFINCFGEIDKSQLEICKVDKIKEKDVLFKVELPQMLPSVYNIVGAGLSLNIKLMVASEVLSQTANSIGLMLNNRKVYFEVASMIALVVITVVISVLIELLFKWLSKKSASFKE